MSKENFKLKHGEYEDEQVINVSFINIKQIRHASNRYVWLFVNKCVPIGPSVFISNLCEGRRCREKTTFVFLFGRLIYFLAFICTHTMSETSNLQDTSHKQTQTHSHFGFLCIASTKVIQILNRSHICIDGI